MGSNRLLVVMSTLCLVLALISLPFLGACAKPAPPAPASIKIGGIYSLTGVDASLGLQVKAGYEMAIEDINKDGGVYVKEFDKKIPLELVALDMEGSSEKAIAQAETLYSVHKVVAIVGTTFIASAVGVVEKNKVPTIAVACASQSPHERGYKYWFKVVGNSPDIAIGTFDLFDSLKADRPTKIAIFEDQSDWGIEMSAYFQKEAAKRGYTVVTVQKYTMMARDFSPLILEAKAAGADLVLSNPIMPDGMSIIRQMKELDYNPKACVMIQAADDPSWTKALGKLGDYVIYGTIFPAAAHSVVPYAGLAELNAKFQAKFGRSVDQMAPPAYASIQVIAAAIERAGSPY